MEASRSVEREALAQAALTRVTVAPVPSTRATPVVKDAVKAFNREIVSIPDYLHYRPQAILEALQLISRVSRDLVTYGGKSPKNLTQPLKLKAMVFQSKTHNIEHAYAAILMLGFKEVVFDMEKHLEYCGRFQQDPVQNQELLSQAGPLIDKTIEGVEKHIQMSADDSQKRKTQQEAVRRAALARIDADRDAQAARAAREQAARLATGTATVKSPWKPERRQQGPRAARRTPQATRGPGEDEPGSSSDGGDEEME